MAEAWIIDACRTPRGIGKKGKGALADEHPQHLGAAVLKALHDRVGFDTAEVDDIIFGTSSQRGQQSGDLARMSALDAGYDIKASGVTLDRFCGSGITSVNIAAANIMSGMEDLVIGGGTDGHNNYTQRGSFHHIEETVRALVETFPMVSRLKMLRQWGGIVDITGDRSPILSKTPVEGVFVNCGWGTGGFKAIPGSGWGMAELIAKAHSPLTDAFGLERFQEGRFIDESVAAGVAH